jgi:integrase
VVAISHARSPGEAQDPGITGSVFAELAGYASGLPKTIHYFDDYHEVERHIRASDPEWRVCLSGRTSIFKFGSIDTAHRHLLHALATTGLPTAPRGTALAFGHFLAHPPLLQRTVEAPLQGPLVGLSFVRRELATLAPHAGGIDAAKALLRALGRLEWFGWTEDDLHALRQIHNPLASPQQSPVADGEALLSLAEQRDINEHFEDLAVRIAEHPRSMPWQDLRVAAMLYWNYSNGFRPLQIAKLNTEDVRIRPGSEEHPMPTVVVRVTYVKQRQSRTKRFSVRRMRRAWTPIMAAWMEVRSDPEVSAGFDRPRSLFGLPPQDVSREVTRYVTEITGVRRTPYDMRHTAAQRLADVGANRLLIAEFLTHDNINTANVYIENSPAQAEIVNRALGQCPVFQKLDAEIKRRSISASEHARLEPDQQVMDAPNGYPIVGIGGCATGQSFCTKTPALACYTCPKFMFLSDDVEVHRNALAAAQSIVREFLEATPTGRSTPAFAQLTQTIEAMQAVIADIEGDGS